jgi:predicted Zn-dependent peptidase
MKFNRTVLPNGLRVITVPMPSLESATAIVMVGAGSRYENKKNNGISHFFEHMAFKGTEKRPSALEISSIIDGMGGECNAFTGKEMTGYYIKSAKGKLEISLDILSDMLMHSKLDSAEIDKERGVIIEEINMIEDTPMRKLGDIYEELLYGDVPMGWDIAGTKENILSISQKDFRDYMGGLYSAHNMTVVIAGGVTSENAEELVGKYFSDMPKFEIGKALSLSESQDKPAVLVREKKTEQIHVAIGVRTVPLNSDKKYPLSVLAAILGGGMSSRLFHEVRESRGLAYYVRTHSDEYTDAGSLVSTAGIDPKRVLEAVEVIMGEYQKVSSGKMNLSDKELSKAKEYIKGHLVLGLEDSNSVAGFYGHQELLEEGIENPDEIMTLIDKVTKDDVEAVGREFFVNSGLNLALIGNFSDRQKLENLLSLK